MACLYDWGIWCDVFISDRHTISLWSSSWWLIAIDTLGFLLSVAQSCPFSSTSHCPTDSLRNFRIPQESTGIHRNPQESTGIHRNPQESTGMRPESAGMRQEYTGMRQECTGMHRNAQECTGMHRNAQEWGRNTQEGWTGVKLSLKMQFITNYSDVIYHYTAFLELSLKNVVYYRL